MESRRVIQMSGWEQGQMVLLLEEGSCYQVSECVMGGEWLRDSCHTLVTLEHVLSDWVAEQGGFGEGPERPHTWADSSSPFPARKSPSQASLVAQGLRIHLLMQATWVQPRSRKILHATGQLSTCTTTAEPGALEPECYK